VGELVSVASHAAYRPAIDATLFPATAPTSKYWTWGLEQPGYGWVVDFTLGATEWQPVGNAYKARCVRGEMKCAPACAGRVCGPDGCGGDCGYCAAGEVCSAAGACEPFAPVPFPFADARQQRCYDLAVEVATCPPEGTTYAGQDAQGPRRDPALVALDADTAYDNRTGLRWTRRAAEQGPMQEWEAEPFCAQSAGWRLPSYAEMLTLLLPGRWTPLVDETIFPGAGIKRRFWTSTTVAGASIYRWTFYFGGTGPEWRDMTEQNAVLCVSGPALACRPQCSGRACGPDGCGGWCGACAAGETCAAAHCVPASVGRFPFAIPRQPKCYDETAELAACPAAAAPFEGQDAAHAEGPRPSYTVLPGGAVTHDNATGLDWERWTSAETLPWWSAGDRCAALELGGFDDWRLPTYADFMDLAEFGRTWPFTRDEFFPGTGKLSFWTATRQANASNYVWVMDFGAGPRGEHIANLQRTRCVRGTRRACAPECAGRACGPDGCGGVCGVCAAGQACLRTPSGVACVAADFAAPGLPDTGQEQCYDLAAAIACPAAETDAYFGQDAQHAGIPIGLRPLADTVVEPVTHLAWQRRHDGVLRTRDDAAAYCSALTLGGAQGFRLPGLREAVAALDYGRGAPAIDEAIFPETAGRTFWTGDRGNAGEAFTYTANGLTERRADVATYFTRCVRPEN
jgi:hypothetical protein